MTAEVVLGLVVVVLAGYAVRLRVLLGRANGRELITAGRLWWTRQELADARARVASMTVVATRIQQVVTAARQVLASVGAPVDGDPLTVRELSAFDALIAAFEQQETPRETDC